MTRGFKRAPRPKRCLVGIDWDSERGYRIVATVGALVVYEVWEPGGTRAACIIAALTAAEVELKYHVTATVAFTRSTLIHLCHA
jgi:hypothetical protein